MKRIIPGILMTLAMILALPAAALADSMVASCSEPAVKRNQCYQECWCAHADKPQQNRFPGQKWTFYSPMPSSGECGQTARRHEMTQHCKRRQATGISQDNMVAILLPALLAEARSGVLIMN